jgi:hypothetical protein
VTTRVWSGKAIHELGKVEASNPGEIAEHAVANRLVKELAYKWWASHVLWR